VISEIAVATLVVSSTSLMVASLIHAQHVDLGFEPRGVLTARLQLPPNKYREWTARQAFWDSLIERVRALPGVEGVAAGARYLVACRTPRPSIEGGPRRFNSRCVRCHRLTSWVLQAPLVPDGHRPPTAPTLLGVAIINETAARTHWPGVDPVGKRFKFGDPEDDAPWLTVVGVVADTRRAGVEYPAFTESYQPYSQDPRSMTLLVRTAGSPAAMVPALRAVVRELDPDQPLGLAAPWTRSSATDRGAPLQHLAADGVRHRRSHAHQIVSTACWPIWSLSAGANRRTPLHGATPQHVLMSSSQRIRGRGRQCSLGFARDS
jgi:hypothetical protein